MFGNRPLLWSEGMFVRNHHFQQWDLHLAQNLRQAVGVLEPEAWGVVDLAINPTALQEGRFEIERAQVVFPGGATVAYPGNAPLPSKEIGDRPLGVGDRLPVYLAIRQLQPNAPNFADPRRETSIPTRFRVRRETVNDLCSGVNEQSLEFLEYGLEILFETDDRQGYETIKIAELLRGPQQTTPYILARDFAPPCARLSGSPVLMERLARMTHAAHRAIRTHRDNMAEELGGEGRPGQLCEALRSVALHSHFPLFVGDVERGRCHPRYAFNLLLSLEGAIAATWADRDPMELPPYDHRRPFESFDALARILIQDLTRNAPQAFTEVPMVPEGDYWFADLSEEFLTPEARVYLMIRSRRAPEQVLASLGGLMKVAARSAVGHCVETFLAGVKAENCRTPPEYPEETGQIFFRLSTDGDYWRNAGAERSIGAYLPLDDPDASISIVSIGAGEMG